MIMQQTMMQTQTNHQFHHHHHLNHPHHHPHHHHHLNNHHLNHFGGAQHNSAQQNGLTCMNQMGVSPSSIALCAGCNLPILDPYLYNVLDLPWHQACIHCFDCHIPLTEKCFSREGKLFCRDDFFK